MQPYQQATEARRSGEEYPIHLTKNLGLSALTGAGAKFGYQAASKFIPAIGSLINKYVPDNLMEAGLKKLDPRLGTFLEGAKKLGYSEEDIRNFLGDKIDKSQKELAKENTNLIEKETPELHRFIMDVIKGGRSPMEAAALANLDTTGSNFKAMIKKLEKSTKKSWSKLVEEIYGAGEKSLPKQRFAEEETQRFENQYGNQQQGQQGIDPQIAQIMQQGSAILQKYKGNP